ncbi:hypothetical protein E2C01_071841 [Portunus trituberculatus]|uniref:Uncharacterized protein n=1 Tax=Portunus trituberculatus TaxID=210409 RepID=A0A5B7I669_PORTR|nr:hypothetical protein [Portunus trituberculatus]
MNSPQRCRPSNKSDKSSDDYFEQLCGDGRCAMGWGWSGREVRGGGVRGLRSLGSSTMPCGTAT